MITDRAVLEQRLSAFAKTIDELLEIDFGHRCSFAVAIAPGPTFKTGHWVTNVSRADAVRFFLSGAKSVTSNDWTQTG